MLNPPAVLNYRQMIGYLSRKLALLSHTNTYAMQFLNSCAVFVLYPSEYKGCSLLVI